LANPLAKRRAKFSLEILVGICGITIGSKQAACSRREATGSGQEAQGSRQDAGGEGFCHTLIVYRLIGLSSSDHCALLIISCIFLCCLLVTVDVHFSAIFRHFLVTLLIIFNIFLCYFFSRCVVFFLASFSASSGQPFDS